ncbi:MAG TPA: hypothetical protein VKA36_01365, partial [Solirubrobacterales bacterium]|nr:hypothetical protein [Solirubrobacterales bacterium]
MSDNPESPIREESWSRAEIDAAIAGLDRATRAFSRQIDAIGAAAGPGARAADAPAEPGPETTDSAAEPARVARLDPETAFEAQMREAER